MTASNRLAALESARGALRTTVRTVHDFPSVGVVFQDIAPTLADPLAFAAVLTGLESLCADLQIDYVVGVESRGFLLAAPLAMRRGAGLVLVRKAGKLPGPTRRIEYDLEYGSAVLEMQEDAFVATVGRPPRVVVVDDVLATGGTLAATAHLLEQAGAHVEALLVLMEVAGLAGPLLDGLDVRCLMTV